MVYAILATALALAAVAAFIFASNYRAAQQKADALTRRFQGVVDADEERERVLKQLGSERHTLEQQLATLKAESEGVQKERDVRRQAFKEEATMLLDGIRKLKEEFQKLEETEDLHEVGYYESHYDFPSASDYEVELKRLRGVLKQLIKEKNAVVCNTVWEVGGSKREGQKMVNQRLRLMLRAFNGESDSAIARVKYNNVNVMAARIQKAFDIINKQSSSLNCEITWPYLTQKMKELYLVHEYHEKKQEEKEEQRRIKEEMREEVRALKEIEKAKRQAEKEEAQYQKALDRAREEVAKATGARQLKFQQKIVELERRLAEAHSNKERAISRAQLTRSGHVYVISNEGSFGEQVYKIGMTRRLDPMDRVRELGDASVPFRFDVHAIIYSEDAPGLEASLHQAFDDRRVNLVNNRKEFFYVSLDEIRDHVHANHGEFSFTMAAEAEEYRKTMAIRKKRERASKESSKDEIPPALRTILADL